MNEAPGNPRSNGPLIALTGATGFLGSHIADTLVARGFRVRASVRPTSSLRWLEGKPVETPVIDLTDAANCARFLAGTTGLIHCAGAVSAPTEEIYRLANVTTTARLLEAAAAAWDPAAGSGVFILVSSLAAHGPASAERPAVETGECRPLTAYGRSKLAAEQLLAEGHWNFRTATLRPPSLYGPRDREFLPLVKLALRGWTAVIGHRLNGLSLVDGRDAAAAAVALLETGTATGPYFVDDGQAGYSWTDLADVLTRVAGRRIRTLRVPLGLLKALSFLVGPRLAARSAILNRDRIRDLDAPGWVCDGSRLKAATGFSARWSAVQGLTSTLDFYREEGWL